MSSLHLADIHGKNVEYEPNRVGFGRGLKKAGELDENVVGLCADLTGSTKMSIFAEEFADRFFEMGIAEQNLVTVGSGLAAMGKVPFVSSYAAFSPGRNWEQIKTTIALNDRPVKIVGAHAGLFTGPDGATHQMLEDIALMRSMPNMVVIVPADSLEAEKAVLAMAKDKRPNYLRVAREKIPVITTEKTPFEIGKAYVYEHGSDVTLISTGTMTYNTLLAAEKLFKEGIETEVIHVPTIKPLDEETLLKSIKKTKAVVTLEEAQINGGLGSAVAELIAEKCPATLKRVGIQDTYGESGSPEELFKKYGLSVHHIMMAAHHVYDAKK
ncbi:MAG: transketolase C-terminal domain-containing protein [Candidatus Saccharibacteria bacterium]|nr:transketolase C-terminal domain-containing protein [Candidatus Saccharibacteria bacterium]